MPDFRELELPMWRGWRARRGNNASTGTLEVVIHGKRETSRQRAAIAKVRARAKAMQPVLVDAIVAAYPSFRAWHQRPRTITKAWLRAHIELSSLIVTSDHFEGVAYVGYRFACDWDPSGFIVVAHGDRIIAAGGYEVVELPIRDSRRAPRAATWPTAAQRHAARAAANRGATARNPRELPRDLDSELPIVLPTWAGHVAGPDRKASRGTLALAVGGDETATVGPAQVAAYRHVIAKAAATQRIVLDAIAAAYPVLTHGNAVALGLPGRVDRRSLTDHVELVMIHLHGVERDGVAYVGYQLLCSWDDEHGLGVLVHGDRVVEVGQADTAFMTSIARADLRRRRRPRRRARK